MSNAVPSRELVARAPRLLLLMVLVIATAGLVYELAIAAVASYLLGDSVRQFSLVIGLYLSALGVGAYLSKHIERNLAFVFVDVELSAALIGGLSGPLLFVAFAHTRSFELVLYSLVLIVGTLVGLELPLLIRVLERHVRFKDLIAKALTFDYAGAFVGSVGFSLILMPSLGLVASSLACGLLNALVGLLSTWVLPSLTGTESSRFKAARVRASLVLLLLAAALGLSDRLLSWAEAGLYPGAIEHREQSQYQRIVLTRRGFAFELFLNGNLQFSSRDERRYHEALVHPAMLTRASSVRNEPPGNDTSRAHLSVFIGGGGDGLAAREVLRWPVDEVVLVDLDPAMTRLGREHPDLLELNQRSLHDPRVRIVNQDAMRWLEENSTRFDVVVLDFPDPSNYSLGKLYSNTFYRHVKRHLKPNGAVAVQASSPLYARQSFWCVVETMESAGLFVHPYHALVPSFGEWGFAIAQLEPFRPPTRVPDFPVSFDPARLGDMFEFDDDISRVPAEPNRLNNQRLVSYYNAEWARLD